MARNKVIRDGQVEAIVSLVRAWPKQRLAWSDVCNAAEPILGYLPSRQGLSQHEAILSAFQAKKKNLKVSPEAAAPMPSSIAVASKRIAALNARIAELEHQNALLRDRFIVWQYNASLRMSMENLDRPLPEVDREVSKTEKRPDGRRK